jgi:hypothetical protein
MLSSRCLLRIARCACHKRYILSILVYIGLFVKGEKLVPQPQSIIIDSVTTTRDKT